MSHELSEEHQAVLDFERGHQWWKYAGAKETAIRERFGWTAVRYFQVLDHVIDLPAALAYDAPTVNRLRRLRAGRARQRSARRLSAGV